MLNLSEIFYSLQGESTYAGFPCIFIRLAECNLRCNYCDTTYSYETKLTYQNQQILEIVKQFEPIKLIEITGGEPLLQDEIYNLIELLNEHNYQILLETNGSISLEKIPSYVTKIVDVKTPGSGEEDSFLLENLEFIDAKKDEIKFVISDKKDYNWVKRFINKYFLLEYKIIFSTASGILNPQKLADWIVADRLPVKFQLQLHKHIWGDEIGV